MAFGFKKPFDLDGCHAAGPGCGNGLPVGAVLDVAGMKDAGDAGARAAHGDDVAIRVELDLPDALERLPQDVETTLFRVIQEALINIHRHTESPTAYIRLRIADDRLALEIEDHGQGMAPESVAQLMAGTGALGVGLAGIRERLKQIHGALDIESSREGTIVRAGVPVAAPAS